MKMNNYELTDSGLVTSDPVIASMFLGKDMMGGRLISIKHNKLFELEVYETIGNRPLFVGTNAIPYPLVREAYQPVEGEGYVIDWPTLDEDMPFCIAVFEGLLGKDFLCYHKRVLNIVTTRAELRELVAKCQEAGK